MQRSRRECPQGQLQQKKQIPCGDDNQKGDHATVARKATTLRWHSLVEVGAAEVIAAEAADELAAAVFEARGAGGAEARVMLGGYRA